MLEGEIFVASNKKHHRLSKVSKRRQSTSLTSSRKLLKIRSSTSRSLASVGGGGAGSGGGSNEKKHLKFIENPELTAIYDAKMWDIFKIILDKCIGDDEINFTIIDPPVRSISRHPLMLIARSGQENLLKHETTRTLLHLKWRLIPRFAFWFNLIFYLLFLLLFSYYSNELAIVGRQMLDDTPNLTNNSNRHSNDEFTNLTNWTTRFPISKVI